MLKNAFSPKTVMMQASQKTARSDKWALPTGLFFIETAV